MRGTTILRASLVSCEPHVSNTWIAKVRLPGAKKATELVFTQWGDEMRAEWPGRGITEPLPTTMRLDGYEWRVSVDRRNMEMVLEG